MHECGRWRANPAVGSTCGTCCRARSTSASARADANTAPCVGSSPRVALAANLCLTKPSVRLRRCLRSAASLAKTTKRMPPDRSKQRPRSSALQLNTLERRRVCAHAAAWKRTTVTDDGKYVPQGTARAPPRGRGRAPRGARPVPLPEAGHPASWSPGRRHAREPRGRGVRLNGASSPLFLRTVSLQSISAPASLSERTEMSGAL